MPPGTSKRGVRSSVRHGEAHPDLAAWVRQYVALVHEADLQRRAGADAPSTGCEDAAPTPPTPHQP